MPTLSVQQIKDYIRYSKQIGDLLQIYTSASVFQLDDDHRKEVARDEYRWCELDSHLERYYLVRKAGTGGNAGDGNVATTSAGKKRNRFNHPCVRFNSKEGCDNNSCKFQPCCNIKGCRGDHPRHLHPSSGDSNDFRKQPGESRTAP